MSIWTILLLAGFAAMMLMHLRGHGGHGGSGGHGGCGGHSHAAHHSSDEEVTGSVTSGHTHGTPPSATASRGHRHAGC